MKKKKKSFGFIGVFFLLILFGLSFFPALRMDFSEEDRGVISLNAPGLRFENNFMTQKQSALEGLTTLRKTYRLAPGTLAPAPHADGYGFTHSSEDILQLFNQASLLLDGRTPVFSADTPYLPEEGIRYYYDESILALVWYQTITDSNNMPTVVTISETFVSDPSQFRRKLSDDVFGAGAHKFPTDMALSVNAVLATSGDFYRFRAPGFCVYDGTLYRLDAEKVDTCAIDRDGNLVFVPANTIQSEAEANTFIAENGVGFTLSFGPIMIENHEPVRNSFYWLGEANQPYPRCCIAQDGPLHYLVAVVKGCLTVADYTDFMLTTGVERCYALDGGQTGTIVMEGTALNPTIYGFGNGAQRIQSDIIYFASAIPDSERSN